MKTKFLAKKTILILASTILATNLLANKEKVIAKIPEASGIAYSETSNTLFVVNDEGSIYEITTKGKILREQKLGKYDLEGIACDDANNLILVANEENETILVLEKNSFNIKKKIKIKRKYKGKEILKKGGDGIEGLAIYENKIYASNQSNKRYPKKDSSVIVIIDYDLNKKKQKIKDIINHGFVDIAGLTFHKDFLYMVSDDENLLIKYNMKKDKVKKTYKLPKKYAQEGITFDKKGRLYIADDKGQVIKMEINGN